MTKGRVVMKSLSKVISERKAIENFLLTSIRGVSATTKLQEALPQAKAQNADTTSNAATNYAMEHSFLISSVKVDEVGTVSVSEPDQGTQSSSSTAISHFKNVDGHRFDDGRYQDFAKEIDSFIPEARRFTDPVRTFAYGTDASFYRLNPKMVVKVHNEDEIRKILPIAVKHQVPVTFRAAGTSLSGQAITDSVLLKLSHTGKNFRNYTIHVYLLIVIFTFMYK